MRAMQFAFKVIVSLATIYHLWFLVITNLTPDRFPVDVYHATGLHYYNEALPFFQNWGMFVDTTFDIGQVELTAICFKDEGEEDIPLSPVWPDERPPRGIRELAALRKFTDPRHSATLACYFDLARRRALEVTDRVDKLRLNQTMKRMRHLNDIRRDGVLDEQVTFETTFELWGIGGDSLIPLPIADAQSDDPAPDPLTLLGEMSPADSLAQGRFKSLLERGCRWIRKESLSCKQVELRLVRKRWARLPGQSRRLEDVQVEILGARPCS